MEEDDKINIKDTKISNFIFKLRPQKKNYQYTKNYVNHKNNQQ